MDSPEGSLPDPVGISGVLQQNKETCTVQSEVQAQYVHELTYLRDLFVWSRVDLIADG